MTTRPAPSHLATNGKRYWNEVLAGWEIEDHLLAVLENACVQLDRAAACRNHIRKNGVVLSNKQGAPVPNPALASERAATKAHLQLVQALGLKDDEQSVTVNGLPKGRPPRKGY